MEVGYGPIVGEQRFMEASKSNHPDITFVYFTTGWTAGGEWHVYNQEGQCTPGGMLNDRVSLLCFDTLVCWANRK
jgi:hypothetical protein